jgi:hypothetical protein
VGPRIQMHGSATSQAISPETGPKLFSVCGVTPFEGRVCLRFRLVLRRLGKLAPVGVTFAFQLGEEALVTLLALQRLEEFIVAEQFVIG